MLRLILTNLLLFILFIILFILMGFIISYAMGTENHSRETAEVYVIVTLLHIYFNYRLLKKRKIDTLKNKTISTILVAGAYIGYLFVYW
jgi:hypothetical protein